MSSINRRPIEATIASTQGAGGAGYADEMREALSHWASGVAVLAATDGDEIDAITVSAFSALSIDPPLVLAAIGEGASILPMIREERRFTISILPETQKAIASAVAERLPGRDAAFRDLADPAVVGALATIGCLLQDEHPGGDHRIVVGRWKGCTSDRSNAPCCITAGATAVCGRPAAPTPRRARPRPRSLRRSPLPSGNILHIHSS